MTAIAIGGDEPGEVCRNWLPGSSLRFDVVADRAHSVDGLADGARPRVIWERPGATPGLLAELSRDTYPASKLRRAGMIESDRQGTNVRRVGPEPLHMNHMHFRPLATPLTERVTSLAAATGYPAASPGRVVRLCALGAVPRSALKSLCD